MDIPSRLPGGRPGVCSTCSASISIQPLQLFGDAACSQCGEDLWFLNLSSQTRVFRLDEADEVKDRVREIVADELDLNPVSVPTDWATARELVADSLDTVEILMMLEEEFGEVTPEGAHRVRL